MMRDFPLTGVLAGQVLYFWLAPAPSVTISVSVFVGFVAVWFLLVLAFGQKRK